MAQGLLEPLEWAKSSVERAFVAQVFSEDEPEDCEGYPGAPWASKEDHPIPYALLADGEEAFFAMSYQQRADILKREGHLLPSEVRQMVAQAEARMKERLERMGREYRVSPL